MKKLYILKIGSRLAVDENGYVNQSMFRNLLEQLQKLYEDDVRFVIVLSGAVALGYSVLGWGRFSPQDKRNQIFKMQQAWAVGQPILISRLAPTFNSFGFQPGMIPYTHREFRAQNKQGVKETLLSFLTTADKIIPVINENDVVDDKELQAFEYQGDNDAMACMVADLIGADEIWFLSTVPGFMKFPLNKETERLDFSKGEIVSLMRKPFEISDAMKYVEKVVEPQLDPTQQSTGGMYSKLKQAYNAHCVGISSRILNADDPKALLKIHQEEKPGRCGIGTHIYAENIRRPRPI